MGLYPRVDEYYDFRDLHYVIGCSKSALRLHVIMMD